MQRAIAIFVLFGGLGFASIRAEDVTLQSAPPVVVKTVPEAGAADFEAGLVQIKVTFSKEMQDGSWSFGIQSPESFPPIEGQPKYLADKRTCVLTVKLAPGKTYALWANSEKLRSFKDADGHSAVPYFLVFQTKK